MSLSLQKPSIPPSSPIACIRVAADGCGHLPLDAPKEEVEVRFDQVRALVLDGMMRSPDAQA